MVSPAVVAGLMAKLVAGREAGRQAPQLPSALAQGSLEPGETLPLKLKWILRREFWPQFQNLLKQGTEVGSQEGAVLQGHVGITLAQGHTGGMVGQAYGDITTAWGHVDIMVSWGHVDGPGYRGRVLHLLATVPTREEGLGEVKMCHNLGGGVREQARDPRGGLPTPKSVPAAVTPHSSSYSGSRALLSSRTEDLQGDAHPPLECPQRGDEGCSSPCTGTQRVPR